MATRMKRLKTFQEDAEKIRAEAVSNLSLDLGKTLNKPESSDAIFVCKNGKKVYGCRWFLSIRSAYLKGMMSGYQIVVQESKLAEVPIGFSSPVMLAVLEFLYTGATQLHLPSTWKTGFETIRASHFFRIPGMEIIAQEFLWKEVSKVDGSLKDLIMEMLSQALEFEDMWKGKDSLLLELTDVVNLRQHWYQEKDHSKKLSENAVDWILSKRKGSGSRKRGEPSVEEYHTFRQLVLWQVYQKLPASNKSASEKLQKALPIEKDGPSLWSTIFNFSLNIDVLTSVPLNGSGPHDPTAVLNSCLGIQIRKESFERLLRHVDWFQVPAMLLLKVIYPLNVIPAQTLFRALASHALHRTVVSTRYRCPSVKWKSCGSLTCDSGGQLVCKSQDGSRSASGRGLAVLPMPRSHGTYEWSVKFSQKNAENVLLGLIYGYDNQPWEEYNLEECQLESCAATRLLRMTGRGIAYFFPNEDKCFLPGWVKFLEEPAVDSAINFRLDASERTCSVSFGDSFQAMWPDLPAAVFHPVIGIVGASSVIVKIECGKGFNEL